MKKLLFFLITTVSFAGAYHPAWAQTEPAVPAVQHGKQFLLDYYQQTFDNLEKAVSGLSNEQLHYKPAPDKWSVSQCLEHIIMTEQMLTGYIQKAMEQPANPERKGELKMTDDDIMRTITDRSFKAQAPKEIAPKAEGKYTDPATAVKDLREQRKVILSYIEGLSLEDMRNHISDSPFGPVDGYHSLLYLPGHTARHTLQIEEIKSDKNFPKS